MNIFIIWRKVHSMELYRKKKLHLSAAFLTLLYLYFIWHTAYMNLDQKAVNEFIEDKLKKTLKEDKGTGCEIPRLNPFAKELLHFEEEIPKIVCNDRDWVKCHLHECRVVREILTTTQNINCLYSDIIFETDFHYTIDPPKTVLGDNIYVLIRSDHVKVECTGKPLESTMPSNWVGYATGLRIIRTPSGDGSGINVLIFGFDSTSKNGFIRRMPKSYQFLTEEMSATVLNGYNIVGDGTPATLFPILTGKTELELPDVRRHMSKETLDGMPFIFYMLKEHGYRTAYFEDMPQIGTFQYRFNGFKRQPTDHYLRAFFMEESPRTRYITWKPRNYSYCVGDTPRYKLIMNITEQFFKLPGKRFGFTFISDISHDNFNMISVADEDTLGFLQAFKRDGHLNNTILLVMGDHGSRFKYIRDTLQGKLEERLPLMAIHLPRALTDKRPDILANLAANANTLTTPHDIHATLLDALNLMQHRNLYKVPGADLYRGLTLFEPIPRNRSCSEAGIEPHWCACLKWQNISEHDPLYTRAVHAFLDFINSLTEPVRSLCSVRTLSQTSWVSRSHLNSRLLAYNGARDRNGYLGYFNAMARRTTDNYQIKVSVGPGHGVYEASATYIIKEDKFIFNIREISRINAYGDEPSCISDTHVHLNKYCYCRSKQNATVSKNSEADL